MALSSLRGLTDDLERYHATFKVFNRACEYVNVILKFVDTDFRELISGWNVTKSAQESMRTLLLGPGNGTVESRILSILRERTNPPDRIHTTVVEPAADMLERYKQKTAAEALPDMTYDWRTQTMEDYQATPSNQDAKFHFICSMHSIYYVPDLEATLKYLYERLEPNGIMLIVLISDNSVFTSFGKIFPELKHVQSNLPTSADIRAACVKQNIPIADDLGIINRINVTDCLVDTEDLTEEGRLLLDFMSHVAYFVRDAPADILGRFRECLGNSPCSEKEGDEVYWNDPCSGIIIRGKHNV